MDEMEFLIKQEYADLIPRLATKDYERLKKSIKEYGLEYPIVINQDHVVLDGHHRLHACHELGIPVGYTIKDFAGKPLEELKFVITMNINNRQLNELQRTQVALRFKKLYAEKETSRNRMQAWYFMKNTGKQPTMIKQWWYGGGTENLIEFR
jgi:hypothetical protein